MSTTDDNSYQSSVPLKRLKASRACDQCRKLRTRCDEAPLPSSSHGSLELSTVSDRKCKRCLRLNQDCTFILPIGETRDRPKRVESPSASDFPEQGSPTGSNGSRPGLVRKQSSMASTSNILEPLERFVELFTYQKQAKLFRFKQFLDQSFPLIASKDISHNTSVLLTCCVRLIVASYTEPSNITLYNQIQSSIRMYFVQKQAITTPSMHNVQSLLFLSLFVDDSGAGNKFISAMRMACALQWNHPSVPNTDRNPVVGYVWWTIVTQDICSFNVPRPTVPSLFDRIVSLTEILRLLIRPDSVGEYVVQRDPLQALKAWEHQHLHEIYSSQILGSSFNGTSVDNHTFLQILHAVVLAIFVLRDAFFTTTYAQYPSPSINVGTPTSASSMSPNSMAYPSPQDYGYVNSSSPYVMPVSSNITTFLLVVIRTQLHNQHLFIRFAYLKRFAEICMVAILHHDKQESQHASHPHQHQHQQSHQSQYNNAYSHQNQHDDEKRRTVHTWREFVGEVRWNIVSALSERSGEGWEIVFELNDDLADDETDFMDSASSIAGEGSEYSH